jgi:hypothetical protein
MREERKGEESAHTSTHSPLCGGVWSVCPFFTYGEVHSLSPLSLTRESSPLVKSESYGFTSLVRERGEYTLTHV